MIKGKRRSIPQETEEGYGWRVVRMLEGIRISVKESAHSREAATALGIALIRLAGAKREVTFPKVRRSPNVRGGINFMGSSTAVNDIAARIKKEIQDCECTQGCTCSELIVDLY